MIILASGSPRRRELLGMLGLRDFLVLPADTSEELTGSCPHDDVRQIALRKARAVSGMRPADDVIIAADTLVYLDGAAIGKPKNTAEARDMLSRLSGARHTVYTGVAIIRGAMEKTFSEETDVYMRPIKDTEIDAYIGTGEPMDKAGAYGAQGRGAVFIRRIEGDFFNVMGLPLCRLAAELHSFGLDLTGLSS